MYSEQRLIPRRAFGGVTELSTLDRNPNIHIVAATTSLSRFGCFAKTSASLAAGTKVSVKITHDGVEFTATGEVLYELAGRGMGIRFTVILVKDEAII